MDFKTFTFKEKETSPALLQTPQLHLPGIIPPLRSPAGFQDCKVLGDLLLGKLLVMMLKPAQLRSWMGNQPIGHAVIDDVVEANTAHF